MKLFEKLKTLNPEEDVYIGSKSAFFYIGKPDGFNKTVSELDLHWYKTFSNRIKSAQVKLDNYKATKPSPNMTPITRKVWDTELGKNVETELKYEHFLAIWEKRVKEYENQVEHAMEVFSKFKPFNAREVKQSYRNIDDTANIVIVEGEESSRFWFKSEYETYCKTGKLYEDEEDFELDEDEEDLEISED